MVVWEVDGLRSVVVVVVVDVVSGRWSVFVVVVGVGGEVFVVEMLVSLGICL